MDGTFTQHGVQAIAWRLVAPTLPLWRLAGFFLWQLIWLFFVTLAWVI
jgi:hypothetical protein